MTQKLVRRSTPVPDSLKLADIVADLHWYCLRTTPQKEFVAQEILAQKGIATFCPTDKRWRRRNGFSKAKDLIPYPMVPRFVFAGFVPGIPAWFNLFNLPVIQGCVAIDGKPMRMDEKSMKRWLRRYPNGIQRPDEERYMQTHKEFKAGDLVRVCDGPFDGMVVPVHQIKGREAIIILELFGGAQRVSFDSGLLEAA